MSRSPSERANPVRRKPRIPKDTDSTVAQKKYTLSDGSGLEPLQFFPGCESYGAKPEELVFAAEYLVNHFDTAAAFRLTFPDRCARSKNVDRHAAIKGNRYLRRPAVQALINDYMGNYLRSRMAELEYDLFVTLRTMAFYDPGKLINPDGTPAFKKWEDIPVELRRCVEGIDVKFFGKDANQEVVTLTLAKRSEALKAVAGWVATMKEGMSSASRSATQVSPETEMLLSSVLSQGRKVNRSLPGTPLHAKDSENDEAHGASEAASVLRGLG